jgi:hypothetical protein
MAGAFGEEKVDDVPHYEAPYFNTYNMLCISATFVSIDVLPDH